MIGTREVVRRLAAANPSRDLTEEHVRRALRTGTIDPPSTVAGRFVWQEADLPELARALGLSAPAAVPQKEVTHAS